MQRRLQPSRVSVSPTRASVSVAELKGPDALFIGPNDLHLALFGSAPADFDSQPFLEVLDGIIAAGKRAQKPVGLLLPDGAKTRWARQRWGNDLTVLAIGGDVKALVGWMGAHYS